MVAQPRRIAAYALQKRASDQGDGELVGLRMLGSRVEGARTRMWYCTTGYLVRLIGHQDGSYMKRFTHIIIDECHERSVDADVLCLLCRRLLASHTELRLVLMSATAHNDLLHAYFSETLGYDRVSEPLHVGGRRFPHETSYLEDVANLPTLPERLRKTAARLAAKLAAMDPDEVQQSERSAPVSSQIIATQLELAVWLARIEAMSQNSSEGGSGGAVLIFVPGIAAVEELFESFQDSPNFQLVPIHSTLDFDTQLAAFAPAPPGVTKVIAATNAAESSLTLPDVDLVIDLGVEKAVFWNHQHGSSELRQVWVSKASATQRAGRTGRVRPGRVRRLYPRALFEKLADHNACEMSRQPLEETVLQLRAMLPEGDSIRGLLNDAVEPPEQDNLSRALVSLANAGILHGPSNTADGGAPPNRRTVTLADVATLDTARLTSTGRLASILPLEHNLSRFVAIGACLDCLPEALVIAAGISLGRPVFRNVTPLVTADVDEYNETVRLVSEGRRLVDRGMYSDTLEMVSLVAMHQSRLRAKSSGRQRAAAATAAASAAGTASAADDLAEDANADDADDATVAVASDEAADGGSPSMRVDARWCEARGVAPRLMRRLLGSLKELQGLCAKHLKLAPSKLALPVAWPPPGREGSFRLHVLRVMLVWSFPRHLARAPLPSKSKSATPAAAMAAGNGGEGGGGGGAAARAAVHLGVVLSDAQINTLLPPSESVCYAVETRRCDVVQMARAMAPPWWEMATTVEQLLIPWLRPSWVLVQARDSGGETRLQVWCEAGCIDELEGGLASIGALHDDGSERAYGISRTRLKELHADAHPLGLPPPPPPSSGGVAVSSDPAAYGSPNQPNSGSQVGGGVGGLGTTGNAVVAGPRYMHAVIELRLNKGQQKELDRFKSRRGIAREAAAVTLTVHHDGSGTLVVSNCAAALSAPAPIAPAPSMKKGGGTSAAPAALTADAGALMGALCGASVQYKLMPNQGETKQTLRFDEPLEPAELSAIDDGKGIVPLLLDRAWGVRLLALMAAGHRDRTLRITAPDEPAANATTTPATDGGSGSSTMVVPTGVAEGLAWTLMRGQTAAGDDDLGPVGVSLRALLPRHSLTKVALPDADALGLAPGAPLWAVGCSAMLLGGNNNRLVTLDAPTLLPPGGEWLAIVMRANGNVESGRGGCPAGSGERGPLLVASQLVAADALAGELNLHALRVQPRVLVCLRALLDPWLTCEGDDASHAAEEPCPICLNTVHATTRQLPRVKCATCQNGFHASCIYRWLARKDTPEGGQCPMCRAGL